MKRTRWMVTIMIAVLLTTIAGTAHGATFIDIHDNPHREAIEDMARLGILEGVGDNRFAPELELNRAAAAKVAAYLLGYTASDAQGAASWTPIFDDVHIGMGQHEWAVGWINLVASEGVIIGLGDGNYGPGNALQSVQWVTILTRILGHEEENMEWPHGYNRMAADLGLDAGFDYQGAAIVNRGEMARMTATAIFDVERPDGTKIIDVVDFDVFEDHEDADEEDFVIYSDVRLSVSASEPLLAAGGGQTMVITARATHGAGLPAANTRMGFFAAVDTPLDYRDRRGQLSATELTTDSNGMARVTYTTLAADDDQHVFIQVGAPQGNDWTEQGMYILASDTASLVQGRVINPFTGDPYSGASISFDAMDHSSHTLHEDATDEDGRYALAVSPGDYYMALNLDLGDAPHYTGEYGGSASHLRGDNTVILRLNVEIGEAQTYTLDTERGVVRGTASNVGSDGNLYAVGSDGTFIAEINADGSFMIAVPAGRYSIGTHTGTVLIDGVSVTAGSVTDVGSLSR